MSQHTPEPWRIATLGNAPQTTIVANDNETRLDGLVADCDPTLLNVPLEECAANAARIVACVNGCAGLNPAAYRECLEALRRMVWLVRRVVGTGDADAGWLELQRADLYGTGLEMAENSQRVLAHAQEQA